MDGTPRRAIETFVADIRELEVVTLQFFVQELEYKQLQRYAAKAACQHDENLDSGPLVSFRSWYVARVPGLIPGTPKSPMALDQRPECHCRI